MTPLQNIVVPVDFSSSSQAAVEFGVDLAQRYGARLHLLHVLQDLDAVAAEAGSAFALAADWLPQLQKVAEKRLTDLAGNVPVGVTLQQAIRQGPTVTEIIGYADSVSAGLIVMGTHGRTGLKHILLGSVAENIVRHAHCPVLTVRQPKA